MVRVVKLAQRGYDVKTAGDENLTFNSQWPTLKIYSDGPFTIGDVTQNTRITGHDLGFPPMFWFYANSSIQTWLGSGAITTERRSEFFGPIGSLNGIKVNDGEMIFTPGGSLTGSLQIHYYILGVDLSTPYVAPIIKVGAQSSARATNRVFKIAKEGKDARSTNLRDFIIHSRARSPMLHSVNVSPGAVTEFTVEHGLGYVPMFFGYIKEDGYYTLLPTGTGGSTTLTSTEDTVTFTDTSPKELTIVVLKDPFIIDYRVDINV
jgi:hypothetical protein